MSGTASENVFILDESFFLPSLGRHRRIWVYRPVGYEVSNDRYPVIYMHDGQNLFDELKAFGSEWGVDETLDGERGQVIVIGIANGGDNRMSEYMLHDHPDHGAAEGAIYLKDIIEVLKPYVDSLLRTRPEKEYTCMAGSSMGGLIAFYAGLHLPHIFGAIGVFSPAIWLDAATVYTEAKDMLNARVENTLESPGLQRWYFYAGALESETMIVEVATLVKTMRESPVVTVTYQLDGTGIHDEVVWKNYFPDLYRWFIGNKPAEQLEKESEIKIE